MGLRSWLRRTLSGLGLFNQSRGPHRLTVADRLRAKVAELTDQLRTATDDLDIERAKVTQLTRRAEQLDQANHEQKTEIRKLEADVDVLENQIDGMAKVIASWEARAEAATARASVRIAAAHGGLGGINAQQIFDRD